MARVPQAGSRGHGSAALDRTRAAVRRKKPYKVVMEMVTQQRKKLRSTMAYSKNAPEGYTFVPLGTRDLTEYCKEQCRAKDLVAHIVSARPKTDVPRDPAKEEGNRIDTQRVGHHFPDAVVEDACRKLHYYRTRKGFSKYRTTGALWGGLQRFGERFAQDGREQTELETKDQIRSAMLEVFPKIPQVDLEAIVRHAFEEGTKKVGNAKDLPMARRVQLAVGAYVRHQYTDYDNLLKSGVPWLEARRRAEPVSYAKLLEWRDEANNQELEEIFREIIVLDDDEEEDEGDEETTDDYDSLTSGSGNYSREASFEIVSSRATGRELQPELADISHAYSGGYRPRATASSAVHSHHATAVPTHASSSAVSTHPRLTQGPSYPPTFSRVIPKPSRTLQIIDGQLYELQPINESHPRPKYPARDAYPTGQLSEADRYVRPEPRRSMIDDLGRGRMSAYVGVPHSPEDIPLPSVERGQELHSIAAATDEPERPRHDQPLLVPSVRHGLGQAKFRPPKETTVLLPAREDRMGQTAPRTYAYSRALRYSQLAAPRDLDSTVIPGQPARQLGHIRDHAHSGPHYVDLTTSPKMRCNEERTYDVPLSAPSLPSDPGRRLHVDEPYDYRGLPARVPQYDRRVVYPPKEGGIHHRALRPRYVEDDITCSWRGSQRYDDGTPR